MSDDTLKPWAKRPKYLQRWFDSALGRDRVAYRRAGAPKQELTQPWGTQALADEVEALAAKFKPRPPPATGTLAAAVQAYRKSADYLGLAASTQIEYDRWLDRFEKSDALLSEITPAFLLELRDGMAKRGYRAANLGMQVMKNVCKAPRIKGEIVGNPFELIEKVERPHALGVANPAWHDAEVVAVIEWAIERGNPGFARAVGLGRWGGFRKQTIAKVPRSARIQRRNDDGAMERRIYWVTEKRHVLCDRREDPRLTALLERTEKMQARLKPKLAALTIAYTAHGESWQRRALGHALERAVAALSGEAGEGEEKAKVRAGLTWHGLRHARGIELAVAGASDAEIMSQLDHATPRQAALYRKQAERLRLADNAQDRVDAEVVRLETRRRDRENAG